MKRVLLTASVLLTGCAVGTNSVEELTRSPFKDGFVVEANYQQTYRNLKGGIAKCEGLTPTYLKPVQVDSDLFTDINEGRIVLNIVPSIGASKPFRYLRIKAVNDEQSEVTVFHFMQSTVDKTRDDYRRWANGDMACE